MNIQASRQFFRQTIENVGVRLMPLENISPYLAPFYALWNEKRGTRRFPAKHEITPRDIKHYLKDATLLRVLDDGQDFEYRIVGDSHVQAFGRNFQGRRTSTFPGLERLSELAHRPVAAEGSPRLLQYFLAFKDYPLYRRETLFLPLGEGVVDHILAAGTLLPPGSGDDRFQSAALSE